MEAKKKDGRGGARPGTGGARPGAGRPKVAGKTKVLAMILPEDLHAWTRQQGGSAYVRELLTDLRKKSRDD